MRALARLFQGAGWMAGLVALVSQLALGALVLPRVAAADPTAAVAQVALLCSGAPAPAGRRSHPAPKFLAVCPLGASLALAAVLPPTSAVLPPPRAGWGVSRPFGRAPPARLAGAVRAAAPRGPPLFA